MQIMANVLSLMEAKVDKLAENQIGNIDKGMKGAFASTVTVNLENSF